MPISINNGVTEENWIITYDNLEVQVEASKRRFLHTLSSKNTKGFIERHPFNVFFRVLNEFVWFYDVKVGELNGGHGQYCANLNFRASADSYLIKLERFHQQVTSKEQHLALGFFREGLSSGSAFYQFICYAKILEIPFVDGKSKGEWIDRAISCLRDESAVTVRDRKLEMLGGKSLGKWLHKDGRDPLSHAKIRAGETVRDPNSFKDLDEIIWGNVVMRELAEKILVEELHIPHGAHSRRVS